MKWTNIKTIFIKDAKLFFRDKFFGIMAIGGLVMYTGIYFIMPTKVDETIKIALYAPILPGLINEVSEKEGIIIDIVENDEELKQSVLDNEYHIGISVLLYYHPAQ